MASTDKMLGRLSAWSTGVLLVGVAAFPFLPGSKIERPPTKPPAVAVPKPAATTPAPTPLALPPAEPARQPAPAGAQPAALPATAPVAPPDVWTEQEQAAALRACVRLLAPVKAEVTLMEPIKHGQCGTAAPVELRSAATGDGKVELSPAPLINCRLAADLARWVDEVLQPAARDVLKTRVTRIIGVSGYSCRNVYNKPDLPLSQHALGSAVDIVGFVTADGRTIKVAKAWGPTERDIAAAKQQIANAAKAEANKSETKAKTDEEALDGEHAPSIGAAGKKADAAQKGTLLKTGLKPGPDAKPATAPAPVVAAKTPEAEFVKRLHRDACGVFGTVLGPEANEAHRDHFHLDVRERTGRGVCH
jgi:hypothetical protein